MKVPVFEWTLNKEEFICSIMLIEQLLRRKHGAGCHRRCTRLAARGPRAAPGLRHVAPELHPGLRHVAPELDRWDFFFPSKQGFQLNDQPM